MKTEDLLMLIAVLLGPILAVQAQRLVDKLRETRNRKLYIFKTLMATRAANLSAEHVQALNMIDVEFPERGRWKQTVHAWRGYFDQLNVATGSPEDTARWEERRVDLMTDLLYAMGKALGYEFDKVKYKRGIYAPQGHVRIEEENHQMRTGLIALLQGRSSLQVSPAAPPVAEVATTPKRTARR